MDNIKRIETMEKILDDNNEKLQKLQMALINFQKFNESYPKLSEYYGSDLWYQDIENYDQGKIPNTIKAGVLTQDSIYDLMTERYQLALDLLELAQNLLKIK